MSAVPAVFPRSSGWNCPLRPAIAVERRIYVTRDITKAVHQYSSPASRGQEAPTRNIHVWTVDVVSRRQIPLLSTRAHSWLARPGLVPPGEKNQVDFVDDIRVCNVEVVFKQVHTQVPVYLVDSQHHTPRFRLLASGQAMKTWGKNQHTFWSMSSCPCRNAVLPKCAATCAAGSFINCPYCPNMFCGPAPPCC